MQSEQRIAFYMPSFGMGDAQMVAAMAVACRAAGFAPQIIADEGGGPHRAAAETAAPTFVLSAGSSGEHRLKVLLNALRLYRALKYRRPDWLLISHTALGAAVGVMIAKRLEVRSIVFLTGAPLAGRGLNRLHNVAYRLLSRATLQADILFADARYVTEAWAKFFGGRKAQFFGRVPLPRSRQENISRPPPTGQLTVLTIARYGSQKRVDVAVEAIRRARDAGLPVSLHVLGTGPDCSELVEIASRYNIPNYVTAHGYSEDVLTHLENADIYLQTSDWEPLGMGILEALNCGLRVVSTDCSGPQEILNEGVGWLAPRGDAGAIAAALLAASRAPAFDQRRQERAQEYNLYWNMPRFLALIASSSRSAT